MVSEVALRDGAVTALGFVDLVVQDLDASGAQLSRKVPHGAQKNRDALLGRRHVLGLFVHFCHPHSILLCIKICQCGSIMAELIAQHHNQVADLQGLVWGQMGVHVLV